MMGLDPLDHQDLEILTGPTAPTSGGLLKFAGVVAAAPTTPAVSFLTDFGVGLGAAGVIRESPAYPFAVCSRP